MGIIKKHKYLLIGIIVANIIFLQLSYWEYGKIRITFLHAFFGLLPLVLIVARIIKEKRNESKEEE